MKFHVLVKTYHQLWHMSMAMGGSKTCYSFMWSGQCNQSMFSWFLMLDYSFLSNPTICTQKRFSCCCNIILLWAWWISFPWSAIRFSQVEKIEGISMPKIDTNMTNVTSFTCVGWWMYNVAEHCIYHNPLYSTTNYSSMVVHPPRVRRNADSMEGLLCDYSKCVLHERNGLVRSC